MIEKVSIEELAAWRSERISLAIIKSLNERRAARLLELRNAAIDGSLDRVRAVSGSLQELEWMHKLVTTKGDDDR